MTPRTRAFITLAALSMSAPGIVQGQGRNPQAADGRLEVSIGPVWFGSRTFAEVASTQLTPSGPLKPVALTSTSLDASAGLAARVGVSLTSRLTAEGAVSLNPTHLVTSVSDDIENFADLSATEPVTQYLFEGGLRWRVGRLRRAGFAPFLSAGGGYLRHLHDQQTLASSGRSFYVGGGGTYPVRRGNGWIKAAGLRFDIRLSVFAEGVATDEATHAAPTVGGGLFIRF